MYLTECWIRNVGPISNLFLEFGCNQSGKPKPIILVGPSGAGKTILLSHVVDALNETAKSVFFDVVPSGGSMRMPYFKISGPTNQTVGALYGISFLRFSSPKGQLIYIDKSGTLTPDELKNNVPPSIAAVCQPPADDNFKHVSGLPQKVIEDIFVRSSICFFPSNRKEYPHWLNLQALMTPPTASSDNQRFAYALGKSIVVEQSAAENKAWLMDVFLDSTLDFEIRDDAIHATGNINDRIALLQGRKNVERLLKAILRDDCAALAVNLRGTSPFRLTVRSGDRVSIPTLDHLSAGQAILFNLFATVIRYADRADPNKSIRLEDIEGIVVIDEIDAHLDAELQRDIAPSLIKLFPRVQFIMTSHSPLFLLGIEEHCGPDGVDVIELPSGRRISTERFSEFQKSFEYYKKTTAFEGEIREQIAASNKPLVLTEGETDPLYIRAALELLGHADLLSLADVEWVGARGNQGPFNSGSSALNAAKSFLQANPQMLRQKVLLLYDCDTNKPDEDYGLLSVRAIPRREVARARRGIENLLPPELFAERFYREREATGDYGEKKLIQEFDKAAFCEHVCKERRDKADFIEFAKVADTIRQFIGRQTAVSASLAAAPAAPA
jgi:hypothetical protein